MRTLAALGLLVAATTALAASAMSIDDIAGVYRHRFQNGTVDGSKYMSEDILEIVRVSPKEAYVRARLEFYNGHSCSVSGVATLESDALVYRPHQDYGEQCVLGLRKAKGGLVFTDPDGNCRLQYCGARGIFEGESLPLSSRRPIRYMPRLLASREYAAAMAERGRDAPPPKVAMKVEPMQASGPVARYPRLTVFPDMAVRAKVNAWLARMEREEGGEWKDCASRLPAAEAQAFRIDMRVTYLTSRYLSLTQTPNHVCPGSVGNTNAHPELMDLSTGGYVNTADVFTAEALYGRSGGQEGTLAALYRTRFAPTGAGCRDAFRRPLHFVVWLDAQKGLMIEPEAHACGRPLALSPKEAAPYVQDARLMADINATVRSRD